MFILDTDHLSIVQRRSATEHENVIRRMRQHPLDVFYVTIVSFQEQMVGWNAYIRRAREPEGVVRGYAMLQEVLSTFGAMNVLPFDSNAARKFDELRKAGVRVGTMDLRIGSVALAHGFTVLTRNTVDFGRIPGLRVEDWTVPVRAK